MHSHHRVGGDASHRQVDVPTIGIYESLRQFQLKQQQQAKVEPSNAASVYREIPNDLDRIALANSEAEVLDLLNQLLQVLHRSVMMDEVPEPLRMASLSTSHDLRITIRKFQGGIPFTKEVDWNSDALFVLRTIFAAAEERLRILRRRK